MRLWASGGSRGFRVDRGESQRTAPSGATSSLRAPATSRTPVAEFAESCTASHPPSHITEEYLDIHSVVKLKCFSVFSILLNYYWTRDSNLEAPRFQILNATERLSRAFDFAVTRDFLTLLISLSKRIVHLTIVVVCGF